MRPGRIAALVLLATVSWGCVSPAVRNYQRVAEDSGFRAGEVAGGRFTHRVFFNHRANADRLSRLHVYIDGDGLAWRRVDLPAMDPTARDPLVLRLMARDRQAAMYLGRPCYLGLFDPAICTPWYWTHGRYGEMVVDSMTLALRQILSEHRVDHLVLIGYSGGGSLAMLIAARLNEVDAVVTLAANLDTEAWAALHGYSPLAGSLNPARLPALPARVQQVHWAGDADGVVPPYIVERGLAGQPGVTYRILPGVDHRCCWEERWSGLLEDLTTEE